MNRWLVVTLVLSWLVVGDEVLRYFAQTPLEPLKIRELAFAAWAAIMTATFSK